MKQYIKENWKPLLVGYSISITLCHLIYIFEAMIMKIAILLTQ